VTIEASIDSTVAERFSRPHSICVVGGAGHVGLPLGLVLVDAGNDVTLLDINQQALDLIVAGVMPFSEKDADPLLERCLASNRLKTTTDPAAVADADTVIVIIGTPVDEFLNPTMQALARCADELAPYLRDDQLVVLRSTIYPGTTDWIAERFAALGCQAMVAFCPERVVQGQAINEVKDIPQIVSGTTPAAETAAAALFGQINREIVHLKPIEAEFVKLFSNAYRYIEFAAANQFFMMATEAGADYERIRHGMTFKYPRMGRIPSAGFAAGPCLFKDTMQLAAFSNSTFGLGQGAVAVNEGLPAWLVERLTRTYDLRQMVVGILGAAFKADCDDPRSSLSYKLRKVLQFRAKEVLMTDPYVIDERLVPLSEVLARSDLLIVATPHSAYRTLDLGEKIVVDIWNLYGQGTRF
jgi:UDP-N-acetyl-D-mannosaminuronic acid dehydrogenase